MDNEVIINVVSRNGVKSGFDAAKADAVRLGNDIEKGFKDSGKRSGKSLADGISSGVNDSGSGVGEKITRGVEQSVRGSKSRFKKSGEELGESLGVGTGVKLGKGIVGGVSNSLPEMGKRLSTEFSAIAAQATPILATVGIAAAPLIGATLSGAIIGGAGIGGVIGGVMLASRDQRVAQASVQLGNTINSQLTRDAKPFIQPTLNAIAQLQKAFDANDSHIQNIFKNSARYVEPLTNGITGLLSGLTRGLDALTSNAGPVIGAIGKGLTEVGNSLGDAFTTISGQSEGAAAALGDLFGAISGIIQVVGPLLAGLSAVYGVLHDIGATRSIIATLAGPIGMIGDMFLQAKGSAEGASVGVWHAADSMSEASSASQNLYGNLQSATASIDTLRASAHALTDQNNDLYSSTTDVASAMAEASKKIKENGRDLRLSSKDGRENRQTLSSVAGALQKNYDAYVKVNGVGPKSARLADELRGKFVGLAEKAGLSAGAARNLANQLLAIPSSRNTKITAQAAQALEAAREVRRAISAVQSKTVTLTIARKVTGSSASDSALQSAINKQQAAGGIAGSANGASPSGLTWVGEAGPELLALTPGSRVYSNPDSMRAGGPGGKLAGPGSRLYDRPDLPHPGDPLHGPGLTSPGAGGAGPGGDLHRKSRNPFPRYYHHDPTPGGRNSGGSSGGGGSGGGGDPFVVNLILDGKVLVSALVDPMRNFVRYGFGGSVQKAYGAGAG